MSFPCVKGGRECDGCMACKKQAEVIGYCAECDEEIVEGESHYNFYGELVHYECLREWAERYAV